MMDMNYKGTVMHIGAAPAKEQIYCYRTSDKAQEKACIGHLRGDFGADGEGFFTSWFPHTGKIMGCTLFCADASEMINIVNVAMKSGQHYSFLRDFIFTHPSMSEVLNQLFTFD